MTFFSYEAAKGSDPHFSSTDQACANTEKEIPFEGNRMTSNALAGEAQQDRD